MKALLTSGEYSTRVRKVFAVALIVVACGCQFSVRGSAPSTGDGTPPSVAPQYGLDVVDLASHLDVGTVLPDLSTLPGNIGDACSGQCGSGLTCMTWVPAGYCSRTCNGSADCPKGSSCVDVGGQGQYCLLDENGGCTRADVGCIDCGAKVCGPSSFCDGC
jgi:hypothetical protein